MVVSFEKGSAVSLNLSVVQNFAGRVSRVEVVVPLPSQPLPYAGSPSSSLLAINPAISPSLDSELSELVLMISPPGSSGNAQGASTAADSTCNYHCCSIIAKTLSHRLLGYGTAAETTSTECE